MQAFFHFGYFFPPEFLLVQICAVEEPVLLWHCVFKGCLCQYYSPGIPFVFLLVRSGQSFLLWFVSSLVFWWVFWLVGWFLFVVWLFYLGGYLVANHFLVLIEKLIFDTFKPIVREIIWSLLCCLQAYCLFIQDNFPSAQQFLWLSFCGSAILGTYYLHSSVLFVPQFQNSLCVAVSTKYILIAHSRAT